MKSKRNSYTAGVSYLSLFYGVLPNSIPLGDFRSEDQWWRSGPRLSDVIFALTPNGAEAEASSQSTSSTESHHEQVSYRYYRFGNRFFDARFSNARARFPPRFRDIPDVSRNTHANPEHHLVQSTEQGSQSWNATGQVNDPNRSEVR